MKIGMISLGCAKNLVDTENVLGLLRFSGQELTTSYEEAEAIIINTCGFIESAKSEAIETILETADLKKKGLKKLIVMGCLSQRYKKDLEEEMPEVDRFIAIDEYSQMGAILSDVLGVKISNQYGLVPRVLSGKPWMAYLQISDGCDNRCSFCAIPLIRGRLHSREEAEVIAEAKKLATDGVKEITLVAQDCSRYGFEKDHKAHLSHLLQELDKIEGIHWIRMLYLYPDEVDEELIETIAASKHVVPYFDIPSQSGSNRILKAMRRRTTREKIIGLCKLIRTKMPRAILRTTLIAGFPGETEEDFQDTLAMIQEIEFDRLGVFTFSPEEGTAAFDMEDDVSEEEKQARKDKILAVQQELGMRRLSERIGREAEVMVERQDPLTMMYIGRSSEFAPDNVDGCVRFHSDREYRPGDFTMVRYTKMSGQNLIGEEI